MRSNHPRIHSRRLDSTPHSFGFEWTFAKNEIECCFLKTLQLMTRSNVERRGERPGQVRSRGQDPDFPGRSQLHEGRSTSRELPGRAACGAGPCGGTGAFQKQASRSLSKQVPVPRQAFRTRNIARGARRSSRGAIKYSAPRTSSSRCSATAQTTGPAREDLPLFRRDQVLIGFLRPLGSIDTIRDIAERGVTSFSVEMMPRTTCAQNMDALSSMATICGYKAVVVAAILAAPNVPHDDDRGRHDHAARALIIGAGVAGLQAIATAKKLGAVASAYDLRPASREQVQSLGGRFVELDLEAKDAEDARGYARGAG